MTAVYGRVVGGVLRISAIVLMLYAGLLVLTYWQFNHAPTGFIPQQDKGYLASQRAVAGFRLGGTHATGHGPHRNVWLAACPGLSTRSAFRASRCC